MALCNRHTVNSSLKAQLAAKWLISPVDYNVFYDDYWEVRHEIKALNSALRAVGLLFVQKNFLTHLSFVLFRQIRCLYLETAFRTNIMPDWYPLRASCNSYGQGYPNMKLSWIHFLLLTTNRCYIIKALDVRI